MRASDRNDLLPRSRGTGSWQSSPREKSNVDVQVPAIVDRCWHALSAVVGHLSSEILICMCFDSSISGYPINCGCASPDDRRSLTCVVGRWAALDFKCNIIFVFVFSVFAEILIFMLFHSSFFADDRRSSAVVQHCSSNVRDCVRNINSHQWRRKM